MWDTTKLHVGPATRRGDCGSHEAVLALLRAHVMLVVHALAGRMEFHRDHPGALTIERGDAITVDGQELFNLLAQRAISDVILMGVHQPLRPRSPQGIRQLIVTVV